MAVLGEKPMAIDIAVSPVLDAARSRDPARGRGDPSAREPRRGECREPETGSDQVCEFTASPAGRCWGDRSTLAALCRDHLLILPIVAQSAARSCAASDWEPSVQWSLCSSF